MHRGDPATLIGSTRTAVGANADGVGFILGVGMPRSQKKEQSLAFNGGFSGLKIKIYIVVVRASEQLRI